MLGDSGFLRFLERLNLVMNKSRPSLAVGHHLGHRPGSGLDFREYRPYQRGDDLRYLDWNLFSRLEQLFLKEFTEERDFLVYFLIDQSRSMGFGTPSKLQYALRLAAALGYIALAGSDQVGAACCSEGWDSELKPLKGKRQAHRFFQYLESAGIKGRTDLNRALATLAWKVKQPGLAVILSDLLAPEEISDGLRRLRTGAWEIWVLQILTPWELNPSLEAEVLLIDAETGRRREMVITDQTIAAYRQRLHTLQTRYRQLAPQYGYRFLTLSTAMPLEEVLFETMRKERLIV